MFVNFGYVGVNRFIGVYRVISGRERKSFGIFPGVHRLYSLIRQPHTHEIPPTDTRRLKGRHTEEHVYLTTLTRTPADRVPICIFFTRFRPDVSRCKQNHTKLSPSYTETLTTNNDCKQIVLRKTLVLSLGYI